MAEFSTEISNKPGVKSLEPSTLMPPKLPKAQEKHKERYGEPKTSRACLAWNENILADDQSHDFEEKALKNPISIHHINHIILTLFIAMNEKTRSLSVDLHAKRKAGFATTREETTNYNNIYDKENKYSVNEYQNDFKKSASRLKLDVTPNAQKNRQTYFENDLHPYTGKSSSNNSTGISNLVGNFQSITSKHSKNTAASYNPMAKYIKR